MGSTRRSFTEEYKDQAVVFVIEGNRSVADVARNIGVHEMTLGRWVKKTRDSQREQIPPDAELTGSERIHSGESLIAWVDRCGHAVAGMLQGLSRKASRSAVKTGTSCARAVAMSERMRQKALSPR